MLQNAYKHEEILKKKLYDTWYDDKYKYYHCETYRSPFELSKENGDYNSRWFASVDIKGEVIGLIGYHFFRENESVTSLSAINFTNNSSVFGMDLGKVIDDIFCKYNIRKVSFMVVCGNPIEPSYDRLVQEYHGRIVGVFKDHIRLIDNKYYDKKMYEIFREDYMKYKEERKMRRKYKMTNLPHYLEDGDEE